MGDRVSMIGGKKVMTESSREQNVSEINLNELPSVYNKVICDSKDVYWSSKTLLLCFCLTALHLIKTARNSSVKAARI